MKRSRTLRRDLERFADRFCDVFDEGLSDDAQYYAQVEGAQTAVERILLEQLHPDFAPAIDAGDVGKGGGLGMRLRTTGVGPSRRAFRDQLQLNEDREAATAQTVANAGVDTGMRIAGIHIDYATNIGLNLDNNSDTAHVRRFAPRPHALAAAGKLWQHLTPDELLATTATLDHTSTLRTKKFFTALIEKGDGEGDAAGCTAGGASWPASASTSKSTASPARPAKTGRGGLAGAAAPPKGRRTLPSAPRPPAKVSIGSQSQGTAAVAFPPDLLACRARLSTAAQRNHTLRRSVHKTAPLEPTMPRHTPTLQHVRHPRPPPPGAPR